MASIQELVRCIGASEDERMRRFCLSQLGSLLNLLLELKLWRLWKLIKDLKVGPPKSFEAGIERLKEEAVGIKDVLEASEVIKDPDPEPIEIERALKVLHKVLEDELKGLEAVLKEIKSMKSKR